MVEYSCTTETIPKTLLTTVSSSSTTTTAVLLVILAFIAAVVVVFAVVFVFVLDVDAIPPWISSQLWKPMTVTTIVSLPLKDDATETMTTTATATATAGAVTRNVVELDDTFTNSRLDDDVFVVVSATGTTSSSLSSQEDTGIIPFVVLRDPQWNHLGRALETYEYEVAAIMNGLSRSLEVAQETEWDMFYGGDDRKTHSRNNNLLLSEQLQKRIDHMATYLEENSRLLQQELLRPFAVTKMLPIEHEHGHDRQHNYDDDDRWTTTTKRTTIPTKKQDQPPHRAASSSTHKKEPFQESSSSAAYDSVAQIMAHIVRDWTYLGERVRRRTYDWCREELASQLLATTGHGAAVLVPGAGLGRLAYDLASDGYSVEANEMSLLMAATAYSILRRRVKGTIRPFLMDYFTNEVNSEWRYESVPFPDVRIGEPMDGSLSYTVGDFVETYVRPQRQYDGIVTCFFLDTATNIYEYLWTIQNALRKGGVWANVGPLQWHRNALLHPSSDELKGLVQSFGFEIVQWSVDSIPIDYRYEDTTKTRSTKYEAFRPLRMVAIRK